MLIYKKLKNWIFYQHNYNNFNIILYDRYLLWLTLCLMTVGFIMITSASIAISQHLTHEPFYFAKRDIIYLIISCLLSLIVLNIPINWWKDNNLLLLIITLMLLIMVLILGVKINGASRWINTGIIHFQPSEIGKLSIFCYISNYISKINHKKKKKANYFNLILILIIIFILLLLQPDLGTVIIIFMTTITLLFISIIKLTPLFIGIVTIGIFTIPILIYFTPYRLKRITSFINPWADPFDTGYQLSQSLIAFGRGQVWGEGLGNSIQKLEYLPESHTDFIFSILAEELGYIGVIIILTILFFIIFRGIKIGKQALDINLYFSGYLAWSISIWFIFQTIINIGVTIGILPTKGLTLPLISYGGSSLLTICISIAILLRIDFETRLNKITVYIKRKK